MGSSDPLRNFRLRLWLEEQGGPVYARQVLARYAQSKGRTWR